MLATLLLSLLNTGLVVVPIGAAAGTLATIDYVRRINGQSPLFPPTNTGGDGFGGGSNGGSPYNGGNYSGNYSSNYTWPGDKPNATTVIGGVTLSQYCQRYNAVNITSKNGQNYTLNPNQWGWNGITGGMCLNVTTFNNETYATNTSAPEWSATWDYAADSSPVHAFANIMIRGGVLPAKLSSLSSMDLSVKWTYYSAGVPVVGVGVAADVVYDDSTTTAAAAVETVAAASSAVVDEVSSAPAVEKTTTPAAVKTTTTPAAVKTTTTPAAAKTTTTPAAAKVSSTPTTADTVSAPADRRWLAEFDARNADGLIEGGLDAAAALRRRYVDGVTFGANVAVDMFYDKNAVIAGKTDEANYEVMVWLARINSTTHPIGWEDGMVTSSVVAGVNFTLYSGLNDREQRVLTWIAEDPAVDFTGDIMTLVDVLQTLDTPHPQPTDYIGYFAFGTEAYDSNGEVMLKVHELSMDLQ